MLYIHEGQILHNIFSLSSFLRLYRPFISIFIIICSKNSRLRVFDGRTPYVTRAKRGIILLPLALTQ